MMASDFLCGIGVLAVDGFAFVFPLET